MRGEKRKKHKFFFCQTLVQCGHTIGVAVRTQTTKGKYVRPNTHTALYGGHQETPYLLASSQSQMIKILVASSTS